MIKKKRIGFEILFILLLLISATGCGLIGKEDDDSGDFKRVDAGLEMEFVANSPGDKYLIGGEEGAEEDIDIIIDLRNKGTFPEGDKFPGGAIYLGGFDDNIIVMKSKSKALKGEFLPAASTLNPMGGFNTIEFDGDIIGGEIAIDEYNPTIMATACYPYATKASPTVCIDPLPFDERQEKVCRIGSQTLPSQGAPIAVTKIEQEAATGKIQFKIHIKNTGGADVFKPGDDTLNKCSPLGGGRLDRKDFDRVVLKKVQIGGTDLLGDGRCSPFADGTNNIIRLFNGEGFVICILTVRNDVQSAYTTPLNIELGYNYRSTISKQIRIKKLETIGLPTTTREAGPSCGGLNQDCCGGEGESCEGGLFCEVDGACSAIPQVRGVVSREAVETCGAPTMLSERLRCGEPSSNSIDFAWGMVPGATEYSIVWCPDSRSKVEGIDSSELVPSLDSSCRYADVTEGTVHTATGLKPDTIYYFKVYIGRSDGTCRTGSPWSEIGSCSSEQIAGPTGSIEIDGGAAYTSSTTVTLTLSCSDPTGCHRMRIENKFVDLPSSQQRLYESSFPWTLSSGDGIKAVYVQYQNNEGVWGNQFGANIELLTMDFS